MKKTTWIILGVLILIIVWGIAGYNNLVGLNAGVDNQWAQVETQYQRRIDLIPNLVNSVKGILKQEQTVFGELADARAKYSGAVTVSDKVAAANQLEGSLGRLLAVVENYPQLKSSENVQTLMAQLEGTENRISVERKRFNDNVTAFNLSVQRFPSSILAGIFGFTVRDLFAAQKGAEIAPTVNL